MYKKIVFVISILYTFLQSSAQISEGGLPPGIENSIDKSQIPVIILEKPEKHDQDKNAGALPGLKSMRIGSIIKTNIDLVKEGKWEKVNNNGQICRLAIQSDDATALSLYYDMFNLPEGAKLFIYDPLHRQVRGAFTSKNNSSSGLFATSLISGDQIIIEYYQPDYIKESPTIHINEVLYANKTQKDSKDIGDSDFCEVNVNCPEGKNVQDQKRGVCRIQIKTKFSSYWCSGSLVNTTKNDNTPYVLTADHCANGATDEDLQQWLFYFNYESNGCENPDDTPENEEFYSRNSMTGAELIASGGNAGNTGSDFFLVRLNQNVPEEYYPYFNGWDITGNIYDTGYCIHHPEGDLKKLSFFNTPIQSASYGSNSGPSHWMMYWSGSESGHGVTEGGSSGSPLFNQHGLVIGTLTGGSASCEAQNNPDYYGKMSFHWDKNGSSEKEQLAPWLDPLNLGLTKHEGISLGIPHIQAYFEGDTMVTIDSYVDFSDKSFGGTVINWSWEFEGGQPSTSTEPSPSGIYYGSYGRYDVKLIVETEDNVDTLIREDYIKVIGHVYPIPVTDIFHLKLGEGEYKKLEYWIYDRTGRLLIEEQIDQEATNGTYTIDIANMTPGFYILQVRPTIVNPDDPEKNHEGAIDNHVLIKI